MMCFLRGMTVALWFVSTFFLGGAILMVSELRKAPEATEDESGFRVVRESAVTRDRARAERTRRRRVWRTHSAVRA